MNDTLTQVDIQIEEALKALSNPVRLSMLQWLKEPEKHFCDKGHPFEMGICAGQFECCGLSQSTVSAHLASLQRAGLITSAKVGQWIFYKRNEPAIAQLLAQLSERL